MRVAHWRRVPWVFLSCSLRSCLLWLVILGNETTKANTTSVGSGTASSTNTVQVSTHSVGISSTATPEHPTTVQTTSSTNDTKISNPVSSTDSPSSAVGSTLTTAEESTSHALLTTTAATSSETSPSQPMTTDALTHKPTSAASPSSNAEPATLPLSTPTSSVTTQGNPGDVSETVSSTTTFDVSATAGRATQSMPLSTSTSPQESSADSHTDDTQTTQTTQVSPTTSSVSPMADTIKTVTTATSLFIPSRHSSSESVPQHASSTGEVTTFTPAPSRDSHTTQATTTEVWATPTNPDTLLRTSGATELFITSTMPQATSKASTSGGPGGQSTWPPASTSPATAPAISQTRQSQGTETTGDLHTTKLGSSVSDTTPAGTATSISPRASGRTTSASASPETSTLGKITSFSPTFSTNSHTTQSTTELLSTAASPDTTPETTGRVSVTVSSTFSPTISDETTGRPPGLSTQSSSSTSPREVSAISLMAQTQSTATTRGPETISVVSQATDTLATVPAPPSSFTPQGHTSTQTKAHTLSPSATSTNLISTPVSDIHGSQTTMATLSLGTSDGPATVGSTILSEIDSHSPSTTLFTSGEALTTSGSSVIHESMTTVDMTSVGSGNDPFTNTVQVLISSVGISSTAAPEHPTTVQTTSSTNDTKISNPASSTDSPSSAVGSTLTTAEESTSHALLTTTAATSSETSPSQPMTTDAFTHKPTSAASPSSNAEPATLPLSTPTSSVTTQGNPGDVSETVSSTTTFDVSATAGRATQSMPLSTSTSPQESSADSHTDDTQTTQTTQVSPTMSSVSPMADTIKTVTTATSLFIPRRHSSSVSVPQHASSTGEVTTFTPAPSRDSHTTQATTTEVWATPTSPDTLLRTSGATELFITSTMPQATSKASTSGSPGGQSTWPPASTSPATTPAISQTRQSQGTETTGDLHTTKLGSSVSDTTPAGTATSISPRASGRTTSASASPETSTLGKITSFSPTFSTNSHTTQSTTELLSTAASPDTTPETTGRVSVTVSSTFSPTISDETTGRPPGLSTQSSSSTSPREVSAISHTAQTQSTATTRGPETISVVSQATDTLATVPSPPPSFTPQEHTSTQTKAHTLSPLATSTTFICTPVSDIHGTRTTMVTLSPGTSDRPATVSSTILSEIDSRSLSTTLFTSGEALTTSGSSVIHESMTTVDMTSVGSGNDPFTNTMQVLISSVGISSTAAPEHPTTVQTTSSTNDTKISNPVSSTDSPSSAVGSTLTTAEESTSHALLTTTAATSSETSPSQPMTTDALTHKPTSAASPSSNAEPATLPLSTPTSSVTTQGNPGDVSETVSSTTTFDVSATAGRATQSMPLSTSTSPQESSADSHTDDTQTTQTTQVSPTTSSVSPMADTIKTVTTATSLFIPSRHSSSESVPQHASSTGEVTTFTPAPSRDSHTTQATTTEVWATPTNPDTLLRTSGATELFITSTMPQATSKASTSGGPGGQSTWPPASTSPATTPAISQTRQSQGTETTGDLHTTKLGSSVSDTTPAGTATSISPRASGRTTSASASPETSTSGKITSFSPTFSTNSHTTQSTTELLSTAASPDTTPETTGRVSVTVSSTFSPTISDETTGRPPGLSTQSSSSTSPREVSAISHTAQTQSTATTRGPETISVVSQATDTLATVPSPPPSFTPQEHTSTQTKAHTLSPSATSINLISTPVSDIHGSQTTMATLSLGTSDGPTTVGSTILSEIDSRSPSTTLFTSGEALTTSGSSVIHESMTTVDMTSVGSGTASSTNTVQVSTPSVGISSTATPEHPTTVQTTSSTNDTKISNPVSSTDSPSSAVSSTLTTAEESTSHALLTTTAATSSETSPSQPMTTDALTHKPTSAASPSSNAEPATLPLSTPTSSVTTQGNPGDVSETVSSTTTFDVSATAGRATQSMPLSTSTSPQESSADSHTDDTQTTQTTQVSPTTSSVSPMADTIKTVTTATSLFIPSRHSSSESVPQHASSTGEVTTFTPAPSRDSHTTQATTTEVWATPTSPDTLLRTSGATELFITGTMPQATSKASTSGVPGGQSMWPPASTSPATAPAISQNHQSQGTVTTGDLHSTKLGSSVSDTTPAGTDTSISPSTATSGSTVKTETSGMITASLRTDSMRSTATSLSSTTSQTLVTSTPSASTGVSLFPYGPSSGDLEFVRRTVDFTSQLFKPQIGFPLGSSLRDSLYFTDNGQIIFPESDYQIFSYPNPPQGGFTGQDTVALVAPFWDDADFSSRRGTIFYQEYETLYDEYSPLVQKVESWIEKFTNTWSYKARWTLKVTWVNAPAYPAQWTFGTNTYQAILSTDGSKSFTLFLYQSGGMQWDVTQHPGNSVLMGFSSGDGYYKNSPLTFRPEWEKYRPDRFLDSNSGLQGLQVYRLHRVERPNYRLKCLQWLKSQPQWPSWGWNQISCPCSWQQGRWDLRFQPVSIGWWSQGSRQLCSFSSWRGGVCCSYGLWGELLEGWRVWSPWPFDWKLEPQNWCCRWNDKPFFCALYQQRRPRIGCGGYRPPRPAWMFGDSHITTLDGANYTFNGLGDFLLVQAKDGNSSFLLQGRTAQTGSAQATNFIAFAAQYNSSRLDPITVQWLLEPSDTIHVLLNNQTVIFETNREDTEGQEIFNTTGVILTRNGSLVSASFDGTVTISVIALSNILHVSSSLPEEYQNHTEGLLGVWNDNPEDDFKMPNGSTISRKSSEETLFHYGMTWKINGTGLLGKRNDHVPSNFTPVFLSQLLKNNSDADLVSDCKGDTQCVYDTLATRNSSTGLHTRMLFRRYQQMNATLNEYPPSINGSHVVKAYKGQTTLLHYTSNSENVTFTLRNNCTDFKLFENGTLLWTPKSLEPFTLEILARNARVGLSSVLQPKTVVCTCSAESQCLYNLTSWVGNSSLEVADCKCDGDTFGRYCERSKDGCEEDCFPNVTCIPRKGCEACPLNMTGDGRHCAALENSYRCQNQSCPVNYCYNQGHCYISRPPGCQPTCTCPPAFTDTRCFLAGNNFTPTICQELPLRIVQLSLSEEENASAAEVNASVAYILGTLDMRAFLWNSQVEQIHFPAPASGSSIQHWKVISEFQYRPRGPVIDFLNNRLLDAMMEAFLFQAPRRRGRTSEGPRNNVVFYPISRGDVHDVMALNISSLETYFECNGYKGYHLVYDPQSGFTCVSPCSEGYCHHGGQCQHLPDGPRCSCVSFSIYTPWGEHCEHLSVKLGAFFGILFGALGALLLLGVVVSVVLRFWRRSGTRYLLD